MAFGTCPNREDSKVLTPSGVNRWKMRRGARGLVDQLQAALGAEEIGGRLQGIGGGAVGGDDRDGARGPHGPVPVAGLMMCE